jgi:FkbM family methyltransferase
MFEGLSILLKTGVIDSSYSVYCFEPNPNVFPKTMDRVEETSKQFQNLYLYNYAVSDRDGTITFNLDQSKTNQACNILDNPRQKMLFGEVLIHGHKFQ